MEPKKRRKAKPGYFLRKFEGVLYELPLRCECGGEMEYAFDFGRVFSGCKKCTPVETVTVKTRVKD